MHPRSRVARAARALPLFAALAASALSAATPLHAQQTGDRWYVTTIAGGSVGYYRETVSTAAETVRTRAENILILNRLGSRLEMNIGADFEESAAGELRTAAVEMKLSEQATTLAATAVGDSLRIRSTAGGRTFERTVATEGRVLGPEGIRLLSRRALRAPGDRVTYRAFAAEVGMLTTASRTVLGRDTLRVHGALVPALKVEERSEAMPVATHLWLGPDGRMLRTVQAGPFGEMRVESADEPAARLAGRGGELPAEGYTATLVRTQVRLPRAREIDALTLELRMPDPSRGWPTLTSSTQRVVEQSGDRTVLRITRPTPRVPESLPIAPTPETRPYLAANAYVESDDAETVALARRIVGGERDAWRAALRLQQWVAENMQFDLGVVMAPSRELLRDRRGTCVGYAVLLTTLARASGIPARVALGYVYLDGMLGGHAWSEVLIGGEWIPLDGAVPSAGAADAARFAFLWTAVEEGAGALAGGGAVQLFGNLQARVLDYRVAGEPVRRAGEVAAPYAVRGDRYENVGLGMSVALPRGWRFAGMDEVWPSPAVVTLEGPAGETVRIETRRRQPWIAPAARTAAIVAEAVPGGRSGRIDLAGVDAAIAEGAEKAAAAFLVGSDAFVVTAQGRDAGALLRRAAAGIRFDGAGRTADAAGSR